MATKSSNSPRAARRRPPPSSRRRPSSRPARPTIDLIIQPAPKGIGDCPRCAKKHDELAVKPFTTPPAGFTHYYFCPENGEPVLLNIAGA